MSAIYGFKNPMSQSHRTPLDWDEYDNRMVRYDFEWQSYNNTTYDAANHWLQMYRTKHGIYRYTENLHNPTNYLANFCKTYIWGGRLDMQAGDGTIEQSALPIITENDNLRPAIADMWKWSNWQPNKNMATLFGAAMGDSAIKVIDDMERGRVYFEVVHPSQIKSLVKDRFGNVKAYELEKVVSDPRKNSGKTVTWSETAVNEDGIIVFRTYLDGGLYDWTHSGVPAEWEVDYGFVPFVHNPHIDVGKVFGQSEAYAAHSKIRRADNLASQLADHTDRKTHELYFQTGSQAVEITVPNDTPTADNPKPGKQQAAIAYGGREGSMTPITPDIDVDGIIHEIKQLLDSIAREYPAMKLDDAAEITAKSGRALRVLQQPAANKIQETRDGYDSMLVSAQSMGMTMGAMGGYDEYRGLPVDGFVNGDFEHSIGARDVFKPDKADKLEESKLFWETANLAITTGVELEPYLKNEGWTQQQIDDMLSQQRRAESISIRSQRRADPIPTTNGVVNTDEAREIAEESRIE